MLLLAPTEFYQFVWKPQLGTPRHPGPHPARSGQRQGVQAAAAGRSAAACGSGRGCAYRRAKPAGSRGACAGAARRCGARVSSPAPHGPEARSPGPPAPGRGRGGEAGGKFGRRLGVRPVLSARKGPSRSPLGSLLPAGSGRERAGGRPPPLSPPDRRRAPARGGGGASRVRPGPQPGARAAPRERFVVAKPTNERATTKSNPPKQSANEASSLEGQPAPRGSPPGPAPAPAPAPRPERLRGAAAPGLRPAAPRGRGQPAALPGLGAARPRGTGPGEGFPPLPPSGPRRRVRSRAAGRRAAPPPPPPPRGGFFSGTRAHRDRRTDGGTDGRTEVRSAPPAPAAPRAARGAGRYLRARAAGLGPGRGRSEPLRRCRPGAAGLKSRPAGAGQWPGGGGRGGRREAGRGRGRPPPLSPAGLARSAPPRLA